MRQLDLADGPAHLARKTPLRDRFGALLDRWMTSAELYRWSRTNALTRWITRRRTRQVFDLMAGFVYSQVLLACVRLKLLESVTEEPRTLAELAQASNVPAAGLQRLLSAAVALQLLELRGAGRYGLGPLGAPIAGHAGIRAMIEHHAVLYQDMQDPVALLRDQLEQGHMSHYWPYASNQEGDTRRQDWQAEKVARYSDLMSASQPFVVDEILHVYDFSPHRRVLDVGGGQGSFMSRLAQHAPHLELMLFDLPQVVALARANFARQGLGARATAHEGSFLSDRLPVGADLVTLVRVAHDHPDADVTQLLQNIHAALSPGGTLLLAEPMAQDADARPQGDAYFHFYLLAMGSGRLRTASELGGLLQAAGFTGIERIPNPMPLHTEILIARKPQGLPANSGKFVTFT
ncbi:MAG: methyltransferase domain-containing protein [Betaproteobacteria bacterium]|nr:methyltransferase domain-containing protein [Betaproteobacteria bacterium]